MNRKKNYSSNVKGFLSGRSKNSKRINIEQYNLEIDEAMEEVKRGDVYTHEEVVKMSDIYFL